MFILHAAPYIEAGVKIHLVSQTVILPGSPSGHKIRAYRVVSVTDPHNISRREPVGEPALNGASVTADGIPDQVAIARIPVTVSDIPVIQMPRLVVPGRFGGSRLDVKIELGHSWDAGQVDTCPERIFRGVLEGNEVIVGIPVAIR